MRNFSLSRSTEKALPDRLFLSGGVYKIRPGCKNVLRILRMIEDPEIRDVDKIPCLCKWFFVDRIPPNPHEAFLDFLLCGAEPEEETGDRDYDYEFDAPEIYASFLMLFGIDLVKTPVHWWSFLALFTACLRVDSPLSTKVRIRTCDPEKCENPAEAARAKADVQIPTRVSVSQMAFDREVIRRLQSGQGVADLLGR